MAHMHCKDQAALAGTTLKFSDAGLARFQKVGYPYQCHRTGRDSTTLECPS